MMTHQNQENRFYCWNLVLWCHIRFISQGILLLISLPNRVPVLDSFARRFSSGLGIGAQGPWHDCGGEKKTQVLRMSRDDIQDTEEKSGHW